LPLGRRELAFDETGQPVLLGLIGIILRKERGGNADSRHDNQRRQCEAAVFLGQNRHQKACPIPA
jgi:hypothetical protein